MKQVIHRLSACIVAIVILCIPTLAYADASGIANAAQRAQRICVPEDDEASASSSSSGSTTSAPASDGEKKLAQALADAGFSKASTAGVLGNVLHESHFNPRALNLSSGAYGITQWFRNNADGSWGKYAERARMIGIADPQRDNLEEQIRVTVEVEASTPMDWTNAYYGAAVAAGMKGIDNSNFATFILADNPRDAALAWEAGYERPGEISTIRADSAQKYYDNLLADMTFTGTKVDDYKSGKLTGSQPADTGGSSSGSESDDDEEACQESEDVQAVIKAYMDWAKATAADKTHGYDQTHRTGPDYDCSSFVASALNSAGIDVSMFNTHTMEKELLDHHFIEVTDQVNLTTGEGLQNGDILWNDEHTEFSMGKDKTVGAHWNEHKTITGGETGDQTDEEISESTLSKAGQQYKKAFRYIGDPESGGAAQAGKIGGAPVKAGDFSWMCDSNVKICGPGDVGVGVPYGSFASNGHQCYWYWLARTQMLYGITQNLGGNAVDLYRLAKGNPAWVTSTAPRPGAGVNFRDAGGGLAYGDAGHVAVVEEVQNVGGKWRIRISEGNANGSASFNSYKGTTWVTEGNPDVIGFFWMKAHEAKMKALTN